MKENNKNKLLASVCVFSFVAFCFAIANTFGNTYAASGYICPKGWEYDSNAANCTNSYSSLEICEAAITALGITPTMSNSGTMNSCSGSGTNWVADISRVAEGSGATFTLTLNANGGTIDGGTTKVVGCEAYNEKDECMKDISEYKPNDRTGYSFVGWGTKEDATSAILSTNISLYSSNSNKYIYYAVWKENPTHTITFDANGGTVSPTERTVIEGTDVWLPEPTRDGYTFLYWTIGNSGVKYYPKTNYQFDSDVTFKAVWEETVSDPEYTVTYNANGGTYSKSNEKVKYGEKITLTAPTCSHGQKFVNWSISGVKYDLNTPYPIDDDITFTAIWDSESGKCESTSSGGGSDSGNTDSGDDSGNTDSGDDSGNTDSGDDSGSAGQMLEATFDENGGVKSGVDFLTCITDDTGSCMINTNLIPTATREGYTFEGWGTAKSCISGVNNFKITKNTTYYACWVEEEYTDYTVTFNTSGGTLYKNGDKTSQLKYTLPSLNYADYTVVKKGYTFIGWRKGSESNCNNASKNKVVNALTSNLSLVACFEKDSTGITENPNTGSTLLYLVFLTGILALVYTCYYSYKVIKVKNK